MAFKNLVVLEVKGLNHSKTLNALFRANINVSKIKYSKDQISFAVEKSRLNFVENYLKEVGREYEIVKNIGFSSYPSKIFKRNGLVIALIFCFIAIAVLSNFVLGIQIDGAKSSEAEVQKILEESGVRAFTLKNSVDEEALKLAILNSSRDISFVEINQEGSILKIVVVNELDPPEIVSDNYKPIVANSDALITRMVILSGTAVCKVNQSVKAGTSLIEPYVIKGEEKEKSLAKGLVYGRVWRKTRVVFLPYTVERMRTGRVEKINTVSAFNISTKTKPTAFELYESEKSSYTLTALFPLIVNKEIRYELKDVEIIHDFSLEKDMLIKNGNDELTAKIPHDAVVRDRYFIVKELDNCVLIDVYLETEEIISVVV